MIGPEMKPLEWKQDSSKNCPSDLFYRTQLMITLDPDTVYTNILSKFEEKNVAPLVQTRLF